MAPVDDYDLYSLGGDLFLQTHGPAVCKGEHCVLHNPSDHHMIGWPIYFRGDKHFLAERICRHGVGHPDPDSLGYAIRAGTGRSLGVHGCCAERCCTPPQP